VELGNKANTSVSRSKK